MIKGNIPYSVADIPTGPCWWDEKEEVKHEWYISRPDGIQETYRCRRCGWHIRSDGYTIELSKKVKKPEEQAMLTMLEYHIGDEYLCVVVKETYEEVESAIRKIPDTYYDAFLPFHQLNGNRLAIKFDRIDSFYTISQEDIDKDESFPLHPIFQKEEGH
jgi:hypothetical protein